MRNHPFEAEQEKAADERGRFLDPEAFGQPEQRGIEWARNPQMMQRLKEQREQKVQPPLPQ